MKLAVPDLISNSYFPAIAATELGLLRAGRARCLARTDLSRSTSAYAALRDGDGRFRRRLGAFRARRVSGVAGCKLLCAQAQGMYWFLVMRKDLGAKRGDLEVRERAAASARRRGSRWVCAGC